MSQTVNEDGEKNQTNDNQSNLVNLGPINTFHTERCEQVLTYCDGLDLFVWAVNRDDIDLVEFHFQHVRSFTPRKEVGPTLEDEMMEVISKALEEWFSDCICLQAKSRDNRGRIVIGLPRSEVVSPWPAIDSMSGIIAKKLEEESD